MHIHMYICNSNNQRKEAINLRVWKDMEEVGGRRYGSGKSVKSKREVA